MSMCFGLRRAGSRKTADTPGGSGTARVYSVTSFLYPTLCVTVSLVSKSGLHVLWKTSASSADCAGKVTEVKSQQQVYLKLPVA